MSGRMSDKMSERKSDKMPEACKISDEMSEFMSTCLMGDKMSEGT